MHEMGIASSILEAVAKESRLHPGERVAKVGVVVGEYAGVDTESLRFCFEVLAKDQAPAPLDLDIQWRNGTSELMLVYLELEEDSDEQGGNREERPARERPARGNAA
jgi:hypothetical protein